MPTSSEDAVLKSFSRVRSGPWATGSGGEVIRAFVDILKGLVSSPDIIEEIEFHRRQAIRACRKVGDAEVAGQMAVVNILSDLARSGRVIQWRNQLEVEVRAEPGPEEIRRELHAQTVEQLRTGSVQAFVKKMERPHRIGGKPVSILSLLRDGEELAESLDSALRRKTGLEHVVAPYVQVVESGVACSRTGLVLTDVWRYFRHTWNMPYRSVPGRSMLMLIRDSAVDYHPVMGIAALGSAAVKVKRRDMDIGWDDKGSLSRLANDPRAHDVTWLRRLFTDRLTEIFKSDLIEDGLLDIAGLKQATVATIDALRAESARCRRTHHSMMASSDYKRMLTDATSDRDWEKVARLPLYRSKRCEELARLLSAEQTLRLSEIDRSGLAEAIATNEGSSAVEFLIRTARSVRVGTNIADLTVCGAIAPYGPLLGGKLAALLAVSPRVIRAYRSRYTGNASLIASAMAGRALERAADLVYVSTSSLYGSRPCQYDRISIACEHIGGKEGFLKYRSLGTTEGFGSFQFSDATMVTINQLLRSTKNGQRVNYVFGEGASPKFRNLRDALVLLGFDADALLQHKHRRSVFGVSLIENLTGYLLGQERSPRYVYSLRSVKNAEDGIVNWWRNRWLAPRLMREGVLDSLREHTFVYPIEHGGRVKLPRVDIEQGVLF